MLAALIGRSLNRTKGLLLALAVLLGAFQFLLVIVAGEYDRTNGYRQLAAMIPAAVQQMAGGMVFTSFAGLSAFGFFHPIVILVFSEAAIFLASEPAWEVEAGIVDLTLARPISRSLALTRTLVVAFGSLAAVALLMALSARAALHAYAPAAATLPPLRTTVLLAVNLAALGWWCGALALLVSAVARRRGTVLGVAGVAAVALYLMQLVTELWRRAAPYRAWTPYHYFNAPAILRGAGEWPRDIMVLLLTAALMTAAAYRLYQQRDL